MTHNLHYVNYYVEYGGGRVRHQSNDINDLAWLMWAGPYKGPYKATQTYANQTTLSSELVYMLNWFGYPRDVCATTQVSLLRRSSVLSLHLSICCLVLQYHSRVSLDPSAGATA